MKPELLIVATHRNWIAKEFAEAKYIEVVQNFGYSAPSYPKEKSIAWWMPTETAARFAYAGLDLNLATVDANWLTRVPKDLTLRPIWVGTIKQALEEKLSYLAYCKPAEVKISDAPAKWIEVDYFAQELVDLGTPLDTLIQACPELLDIKYEYRCIVNNGNITSVATYLNQGNVFGAEGFTRNLDGESVVKEFGTYVSSIMRDDQPSSYTLDIGQLSNGDYFVLEANPIWASNPYDCDKVEVVKAIIEGSTTYMGNKTHGKFQWSLDPYLKQYATSKAKLPLEHYSH